MNQLPPRCIWVVTSKPKMFAKDYNLLVKAFDVYIPHMGSCYVCNDILSIDVSVRPESINSLKMLEITGTSSKIQAGWMYTKTHDPYEGWIWDPICAYCLLDNIGKPDIRAFTYDMSPIYKKNRCLYA